MKCLETTNLFTSYSRPFFAGPNVTNQRRVIAADASAIHEMAARDATVFFGSLGTSVSPPLGKRLRESTPSRRDQSHMYPRPPPCRKPRYPTPGKISASRASLREEAYRRQRWLRVRR